MSCSTHSFNSSLHYFFLVALFLTVEANDRLDEVLLRDLMPPIGTKCKTGFDDFVGQTSSYTFEHSPSPSYWDPTAAPYEPDLFVAEMKNINSLNENKSWAIRVGTYGNIYSFVGEFGEAVPPQFHNDGEWVDEVFQSVSVALSENVPSDPYFIHQSGIYTRDGAYTETPFFSPSIAKHCSEKECFFGSWGQHAHVPTKHISNMLYFNGYRDCGDGILEYTTILHNADNEPKQAVNYMNTPWGGTRSTTLRDVFLSDTSGNLVQKYPLVVWSSSPETYNNVRDTGGFTTFAEQVVVSDTLYNSRPPFQMPMSGSTPLQLFIKNVNGAVKANFHSDKWKMYCMIVPVVATFRADGGCLKQCDLWIENARTGEKFVAALVNHWAWEGNKMYVCNRVGITKNDFNRMFSQGDEIIVSHSNVGKRFEDNLALTIVHGTQGPLSERRATTRERYGIGGSSRRDYTVYTTNTRVTVGAGDTYVFKQYLATGSLNEMESIGTEWKDEVYEDYFSPGELTPTEIHLYSEDANTFGAYVDGDEDCKKGIDRCIGTSVPAFNFKPLFAMTCGNTTYVGHDKYHFSPPRASLSSTIRSYVCGGESNSVKPTWKLLGYFEEGDCDYLQAASYVSDFCATPDDDDEVDGEDDEVVDIVPWTVSDPTFKVADKRMIEISHNVSGFPNKVRVALLSQDCNTQVTGIDAVGIASEEYLLDEKKFHYNVTFNESLFGDSALISFSNSIEGGMTSVGSINFCTRVLTTYTGKADIDISFFETNFFLHFNMTDSKFVLEDVAIEANELDSITTNVGNYTVIACLCDSTYDCLPSTKVYQQNEALQVCLSPDSTDVKIANFEMRLTGADDYVYYPVNYGTNSYKPNDLTFVQPKNDGSGTIKVTTAIVAGLFLSGGTSIDVDGNAYLQFRAAKAVNAWLSSPFRLTVNLEIKEKVVGCFKNLLSGFLSR